MKTHTRNCPNCKKILTYSSYKNLWRANNKNAICVECSHVKEKTKRTDSPFRKNCPTCSKLMLYSDKYKLAKSIKMNTSCISCTQKVHSAGRKQTEETRRKKRLATIAYIQRKHGQITPAYNISACKLFDAINEHFQFNGQHAENGGEFYINNLGYWVDYYEPMINLVIEFYEKHHNRYNFLKRDAIRESATVDTLRCKLVVIKETDDLQTIYRKIKEVL